MNGEELRVLDAAMMRLRRVWAPPPASETKSVPDGLGSIELSTVLVIETCARTSEAGLETTVADVAAFAAVAPSTGSRFVQRAAEAGLVERGPGSGDARRTSVRLTEAGWMVHSRARQFRLDRLQLVFAQWEPDDVSRFATLLDRFARDATDPDGGAPLVP